MDNEELTMQVLRKLDPFITKKLFASTFSSIFEYDEATSQWLPCNYEGSLYLIERKPPMPPASFNEQHNISNPSTSYRFILLNRKSRDNCIEDITNDENEDMDFKRKQQYVYYKKAAGENLLSTHLKRVIFFSNEQEAEIFSKMVDEILAKPSLKKIREEAVSQGDSSSDERQQFYTKEQVKELLVQMIQSDKFIDSFYALLKKKYA